MSKNSINLVNAQDITDYLAKFCPENPQLQFLLVTAASRILKKSPEYMETLQDLPDNAPKWLSEKWNSSQEWHRFSPRKDMRLAGKVHGTLHWLEMAIEHDLEWLKNKDDQGRPRKLLKLSTFDQLFKERSNDERIIAHKERAHGRTALREEVIGEDIINIMSFVDGYHIVKMISERALDRESAYMEHCIGDGLYDRHLRDQTLYYYSLRAPGNIPCATVSIDREYHCVNYLAASRNSIPDKKYIRHIATFCYEFSFDISYFMRFTEGFETLAPEERESYPYLNNAPKLSYLEFKDLDETVSFSDDTKASGLHISNMAKLKSFPKNVTIEGNIYFYGKTFPDNAPIGWTVTGKVYTGANGFDDWKDFLAVYYPPAQ